MSGYVLKSLRGIEGQITVPSIGAHIGTFLKWTLQRREDGPSNSGYRLTAFLSYVNPMLFNGIQEGKIPLTMQITIAIRDRERTVNKQYRLELMPGERMVLDGMSLLCEGVDIVSASDDSAQ